jgi:hypothetical protein
MYNVVCSAVIGGCKVRGLRKRIDARNARAAIHSARVDFAIEQRIPRHQVKVDCFCCDHDDPEVKPAACASESMRKLCQMFE